MRLIFISIFFCFLYTTSAQTKDSFSLRFQHINEKNGLSNNVVHTIYKDSRGFMWIGTNEGLNMFDGTSFSVYRHNAIDTLSIQGNDIISIAEDEKQQLWISSHCAVLSA